MKTFLLVFETTPAYNTEHYSFLLIQEMQGIAKAGSQLETEVVPENQKTPFTLHCALEKSVSGPGENHRNRLQRLLGSY